MILDNGKVFTGRFGPGGGTVLFDRICAEHDVRHLLTAPRSPTTTGKVERFHKTVRTEFLAGRVFASLQQAQAELDEWVEHYNNRRPHQGIGMVAPIKRFALAAVRRTSPPVYGCKAAARPAQTHDKDRVSRLVGRTGKISLCGFEYRVGSYLAGETVSVEITANGLLQVSHGGVLIASFARRHGPRANPTRERLPRGRRARPAASTPTVVRLVDATGYVSFAGSCYWVGTRHRRTQVEVRLLGDAVEISQHGTLLRTHAIRHDRSKEHGTFSTPNGRPRRRKARVLTDPLPDSEDATEELKPICNAGGET